MDRLTHDKILKTYFLFVFRVLRGDLGMVFRVLFQVWTIIAQKLTTFPKRIIYRTLVIQQWQFHVSILLVKL